MQDIFKNAPVGTIIIIIDSFNTLFPLLKRTATDYGWRYLGDEEVRKSGVTCIPRTKELCDVGTLC